MAESIRTYVDGLVREFVTFLKKDQTTSQQVTGGYDYNFMDSKLKEKYLCPICCCVARNPFQVTCCGSVYCKSCFSQLQTSSKSYPKCPNCRANLNGTYFQDSRADREIQSLKIYCPNTEKGCIEWKGELRCVDRHLKKCLYEAVDCTNDQCSAKIQRRDLTKHLETCLYRQFKCSYCQMKGTYLFITEDHRKSCTELPIPCPITDCTRMIKRRDLETHKKNCPHRLVDCEYKGIGCNYKIKYCNIKVHDDENISKHLALAVATISAQKQDIIDLNNRVLSLTIETKDLQYQDAQLESKLDNQLQTLEYNCNQDMETLEDYLQQLNSQMMTTLRATEITDLNTQLESKFNNKLNTLKHDCNQNLENLTYSLQRELRIKTRTMGNELDSLRKHTYMCVCSGLLGILLAIIVVIYI